jgi:plastocyanin
MNRKAILALAAACSLAVAFPLTGAAKDKDKDNDHANAVQDAVVQFGQGQPQQAPAAVTHFLDPNDVTINKDGTVTFVVNGGGHGVAIYPVAKNTTREDIAEDLCQGGTNDADRLGRSVVCPGAATSDAVRLITDGKDDVVINTDTAANSPRVDDMTDRLLATSGAIPGAAATVPKAGAFLTGTNAAGAAGNRIQYRFLKTGRYLVVCMNRNHLINDHMFGFVNVVDADDDDHDN